MINTNFARLKCHACGNVGLDDGDDGFFYCMRCGSQAEDFVDTGVADEDFVNKDGNSHGALYMASHKRFQPTHSIKVEPFSQTPSLYQTLSQALEDTPIIIKEELKNSFEDYEPDFIGPTEPADFGSGQQTLEEEDYCTEVRMRYVMGIQLMIQYQCEVLVEKLKASPLICGIAGSVWLRFVASTQIFDDMWANETMLESESQGGKEYKEKARYAGEPRNIHSQRMILIWYRSLRKKIPLSCSLAVSYLACHIAREPILPTDILRWTLEGKLPYLAAFVEIEKYIGCPSKACPLSASYMFRPSQAVPLQKLESSAASIAQSIGLNLPPVNFYAIASRYLKQLSLPVEKILPYACRIYEWSMPPDLWLSASELRLPTRVSVMSIVIVALRVLYNLNGFGKWEATLSTSVGPFSSEDCTGSLDSKSRTVHDAEAEVAFQNMGDLDRETGGDLSPVHKFESEAAEFLCCLEKRDDGVNEKYEYSWNLPTYLQYCKDVVFAGLEPLFEDHAEEMMLEKLWDFYLKSQKDFEAVEESDINVNQKRSRDNKEFVDNNLNENKRTRDGECLSCQPADNETLHTKPKPEKSPVETQGMQTRATESLREAAIRLMKSDMEEKRFCYIPPRVKLKRYDYLHYARKRDDGFLTYSSHADYYILLRACARAAQVDIRVLHVGVLGFERRLAWIEKRIDHCLHLKPSNVSCRSCTPDVTDDHISLSNENLSP